MTQPYVSLETCLLAGFKEKALNCEHRHSARKPRFSGLRSSVPSVSGSILHRWAHFPNKVFFWGGGQHPERSNIKRKIFYDFIGYSYL
jgi:hypothetical protein